MKIALLQHNFTVGDFSGNTAKILAGYSSACAEGAAVVTSTELALFGYPPLDLLERSAYIDAQNNFLSELAKSIGSIPLIIGIATRAPGSGKSLHNSAIVIQNGAVIHTQHKTLLPTYDVFDESRYFEPNREDIKCVMISGKRIAILICEDAWNGPEDASGHRLYASDPVEAVARLAPDALIIINGSPYYWGKGSIRLDLVSGIARRIHAPVFYANQVGGNTELVFDGRCFAVDAEGTCIGALDPFREGVLIVDSQSRAEVPYPHDHESIKDFYDALVLGTHDYFRKIGNDEGAVIGLSGGIDSALVACITRDALGADKVLGITMPSKYSSPDSVSDARELAKNLGIGFEIIPIKNSYDAVGAALTPAIAWHEAGSREGDVTEENVQARLRGMILMAISNRTGRIVPTTGNKSETSVGFCTIYGDTAGGLAIISDVLKTRVYALAQYRNTFPDVPIPQNTITKPPTADLRPGQKDTDSLPPYDILDGILERYIERQQGIKEIIDAGFDSKTVESVIRMISRNEFKRRQMPPGLKMSPKAFGAGRRWPIAAKLL